MRDVANTAVKWLLFFLIGVSVLIFSFKVLADECLTSAQYLEDVTQLIEDTEPGFEVAVYKVKGNAFYQYFFVGVRGDSPTAFIQKVDFDGCIGGTHGHAKDDPFLIADLAKGELVISWIPVH